MHARNPLSSIPVLAAAFVLLWNSGFIGAEYGLPHTGPFSLLFWRYAALVLVLGAWLVGRGRLRWPGVDQAGHAARVGVLAHGVWLGCVLLALHRDVPAGIVALVVALQPLATGALSGWVTGERTTRRQWAGLVLGLAGVAVAVGARIDWASADSVFGYLVPLLSVAAITTATLLQRRRQLSEAPRIPMDLALFYQSAATVAVVAVPAAAIEHLWARPVPEFVATMAWLVFAVSLGAYGLMWRLLGRLDATRVASLFFLGPPVTMLMAWAVFGDTVRATDLVGLIIAGAGVGLVQARRAPPGQAPR